MLIVVGIPGSGKSMFADKFSEAFAAPRLSAHVIASNASSEKSAIILAEHFLNELLKTKQTLIVDGMGSSRVERTDLTRMARKAGYVVVTVWVQTDKSTAKARTTKKSRQASNPKMSGEEFERKYKQFTSPNASEKVMVISGKHTPATQVKAVLKRLTEPRSTISTHSTPPVREAGSSHRSIVVR